MHAAPVFANSVDPSVAAAMDYISKTFPDLVRTGSEKLSIEAKLKQLVPLTAQGVSDWGLKAMQLVTDEVGKATTIVRDFTNLRAGETIEKALTPPTMLEKLRGISDQTYYKAVLTSLRPQFNWISPRVTDSIANLKSAYARLAVNLACLSAVLSLSLPMDNALDLATSNRRITLQQSMQQSQIAIASLEGIYAQLVDYTAKVDHMLNVTIPAIEMAKAGR